MQATAPQTRPRPAVRTPDHQDPDDPAPAPALAVPDLRRRNARREAEIISERAAFLPREQQALVRAVYHEGRSIVDLAPLLGVPTRTLRRQLRRLLIRLSSPEFAYVAVHMHSWPRTMHRVAESCILHGQTVRGTSSLLHVSLHTVRKYRDMVLALSAASAQQSSDTRRSKAG